MELRRIWDCFLGSRIFALYKWRSGADATGRLVLDERRLGLSDLIPQRFDARNGVVEL